MFSLKVPKKQILQIHRQDWKHKPVKPKIPFSKKVYSNQGLTGNKKDSKLSKEIAAKKVHIKCRESTEIHLEKDF
jgi:hypothetical protein